MFYASVEKLDIYPSDGPSYSIIERELISYDSNANRSVSFNSHQPHSFEKEASFYSEAIDSIFSMNMKP